MIKKFGKVGFVLCMALTAFGCKNQFEIIAQEEQIGVDEYDEAVVSFLDNTEVILRDGINRNEIGKTLQGYTTYLENRVSTKIGRSVLANESIFSGEDIAEILGNVVSESDLPELLAPTEIDLEKIKLDFPRLTDEEIIENIEIISQIYQSEIALLAIDDIVSGCDARAYSSRSAGDYHVNIGDDTITLAEVAACLKHPFSACGLIKQKDKAFSLTEEYMGHATRVDEKSDAFRHAMWNIVMAKEGWGLKKEKMSWARDFATAHEEGVKYDGLASEMDLHNNRAGLRYYDEKASKKYKKILWFKIEVGVSEPSYGEAAQAIKKRAIESTLVDESLVSLEVGKNMIASLAENELVHIEPDDTIY